MWKKGLFIVRNDRGLHTRPSAELVKCASTFQSEIFLIYKKMRVNAKSLLGILMLAAAKGAKVCLEAKGSDADRAIETICAFAENNFNTKY